ncbi:hypothetical protein GCM10012275_60590 [Longimycelium tulufanense]|uniref:Uncharacterized protein n=1 Tax=Longimycelium tulufanense TaxID=907463 RepID=A0A8J3FWZ6_9PSEU|nr:hypothetical protein [Longimycelium tulufanense]GGM81879.1 hypothetical protein GCM10012275_60590 [Longimycelium tulufanense]
MARNTRELAPAERTLIDSLRFADRQGRARLGADAVTWAGLLLAQGRLFTPAPWPGGRRGQLGACFAGAIEHTRDTGRPLVIGMAAQPGDPFGTAHAWCAGTDGTATAYLGVPLDHRYTDVATVAARLAAMLAGGRGPSDPLDHIPAAALVDAGQPLPPA